MQEYSLDLIDKRLKSQILNELTRSGLLFRLFSRIKDKSSISEKFARKNYSKDSIMMQDLFGIRITSYFNDDIKIIVDLCKKNFEVIEFIYDEPEIDVFRPLRKNMICKLPKELAKVFDELKEKDSSYNFIDNTFEIQFRTTLSEGWHEVDHLMRYKCKPDWNELNNEGRMLNGIYATLETNDQALKALFDDISYQHYKARRWEAMIRNQFRLRFPLEGLDSIFINYLNSHPSVGRAIFKMNRNKILDSYINSNLNFQITFNNFLFFINFCFLKDEFITQNTPEIFIEEMLFSIPDSIKNI